MLNLAHYKGGGFRNSIDLFDDKLYKQIKQIGGKKMSKIKLGLVTVVLLLFSRIGSATEIDSLTKTLAEKGVITYGEAQQLITESNEDVRALNAAGKNETLPLWIQTMAMKGDFRLRYEQTVKEGSTGRIRERIRFRMSLEAMVNPVSKIVLGLATGSTADQKSTNATLENQFAGKYIGVDYVYLEYNPVSSLTVFGGKFKNPLWNVTDLVWDSDINPEGAAVSYKQNINSKLSLFANAGVFVLDEASTGEPEDPKMHVVQPGVEYLITDKIGLKVAFTGYMNDYVKLKNNLTGGVSGATNSKTGVNLKSNYNSNVLGLQFTMKEMGLPYITIFAETVTNTDTDIKSDNTGNAAGIIACVEKTVNPGDWQVKLMNRYLEKDACLDILPDSDAYGGKTGYKGIEAIADICLLSNINLTFDYYKTENITTGTSVKEDLFQIDLNVKF
jgi:hypothetical protein